MRLKVSVLAVVLGLASSVRAADMGPMPGEERFETISGGDSNKAGAALGFAGMDEDFFLQVVLKTELNLGKIGLGLQIPLNVRVYDRDPKAENDYYGAIREEDWDETSEYFKVIRYVRLGHKRDDFYLRVGELAAQIGHGTIMTRYLNNLDVDTLRIGAQFDINSNYGGFETVVGDIGSMMTETPMSRVVGARVYLKPWALIDAESFLNMFAIGATVVSDLNAPQTYETFVHDELGEVPELDDDGNYKVAEEGELTVYGFDFEVELLHSMILDLVPYTDLNFIDGAGWGWHVGVLAAAKMPIGIDLTIPVRVEYRSFRQNYVPFYFSTFYEIERFAYRRNPKADPRPKAQVYLQAEDNKGINGYYGDLAFDFAGIFQVGAFYEDYENAEPNLAVFLSVPSLEIAQFKAYYERKYITGPDDVFVFDDRSYAVAQAQYEIITYVYLTLRFSRRWTVDEDQGSETYGEYVAVDDYAFGIEASFDF